VYSAGHTVSAVAAVQSAAEIIADVTREFCAAASAEASR
jgi:hypothetical protein